MYFIFCIEEAEAVEFPCAKALKPKGRKSKAMTKLLFALIFFSVALKFQKCEPFQKKDTNIPKKSTV